MQNVITDSCSDFKTNSHAHHGVKIYELKREASTSSYDRHDFYKICLVTGKNKIHYADRQIEVNGTILFFASMHVPYSWEFVSDEQSGYACLFTSEYFSNSDRAFSKQQSAFFKLGGTPVLYLDSSQKAFIEMVFRKMLVDQQSSYVFKNDLIRDYIRLLLHEAQKIKPADADVNYSNASSRLASLFLETLSNQFPIETQEQQLQLRHPKDYAQHLSVHVNHLNFTVRKITGKSTSQHIADHIINEAKSLLKRTDWSVADIADCLGFEYATHFTNYFKRITGTTPKSIREGR